MRNVIFGVVVSSCISYYAVIHLSRERTTKRSLKELSEVNSTFKELSGRLFQKKQRY